MKTIKFSEDELTFLRQLYTDELDSAERYVIQIRDVLKKLGGPYRSTKKEETFENEPKDTKRRGRKPKVKVVEPREPKKRGRKLREKAIEHKEPKKRGRPKRVIMPTAAEVATKAIIKPGDMETRYSTTPKKKKIFNRNFSGKRRSKRISLVSLRKPLRIKGPSVEKGEESFFGSNPETSALNTIPPAEE
jgi:hypothetical protein